MYKAAIIGCGNRAPDHIEAYQHIPEATVVACCAPSGKRRDPLAEKYRLRAYSDPAEMIKVEKPDMIHIITWPDTRVPLMTLVSDLQVPLCTVEKPVAIGVRDWRQLRDLERESSTKFAVSHQLRWHRHIVGCREALRQEEMGQTRLLDMSAGMNLAGQGTHILNYGRALIGDPEIEQVFGNVCGWDQSDPGHPAPVASEAYLTFANGMHGFWVTGPVAPRCGDPDLFWQHVRLAVYAARGRVCFEEFGKWEIVTPQSYQSDCAGAGDAWLGENRLAQAGFHQSMLAWGENDTDIPGTSLKASLHEWQAVLALYQSALIGKPVALKDFEPEEDLVEKLKGRLQ